MLLPNFSCHHHLGGGTPNTGGEIQDLHGLLSLIWKEEARQCSTDYLIAALVSQIKEAEKEGIIDLEIRFNPMRRTSQVREDLPMIFLNAFSRTDDVRCKISLCMDRQSTAKQNAQVIEFASVLQRYEIPVVGVDMAGPLEGKEHYDGGWFNSHIKLFEVIRSRGLSVLYHIGESTTEGIDEVIEYMKPSRIGHGVHFNEEQALRANSKVRGGVLFEVCPVANIVSGAATKDQVRKFCQMLEKNQIKYALCTDNPGVLGTTIRDQFNAISTESWSPKPILRYGEITTTG